MINHLKSLIRNLDSFGANYQLNVSSASKEYKSILGGLITLILYGLSLTFFIYNIVQWLNGENLPNVTISDYKNNSLMHDFQEVTLKVMGGTSSLDFDPFDPQELIFQPIIEAFNNEIFSKVNFELNLEPNNFHSIVIKNFQIQNTHVNDGTKLSGGLSLSIAKCENATLPENYRCAAQDKIDNFYASTRKYLIIQIMIQQFNCKTQNIETINNELFMLIDQTQNYFSQIILKLQSTFIDDGLLFQNNHNVTYLNDYKYISQNVPINQLFQDNNLEIFATFYFSLSPNISQQFVQYPKFNEVLADTGSIVELIFFISILAKQFNQVFFEQDTLYQIISLYFPEFSDLKIQYNILGQIKQVFIRNEKLDKDKFIIYYEKLKSIAQDKITLTNIIYEISRLQFIIQNQLGRSNSIKCHQYGIQLNPQFYEKNVKICLFQIPKIDASLEIQDIQQSEKQQDESVFQDQDFYLLSLKQENTQAQAFDQQFPQL